MINITKFLNYGIIAVDVFVTAYIVHLYYSPIKNKIKNAKSEEQKFRKWYHCCKYCKHCNIRGRDSIKSGEPYAAFCFHPDCKENFQSIDRVDLEFFCGKWESTDAFNTELFKLHSERCLESPNKGLKNSRQ